MVVVVEQIDEEEVNAKAVVVEEEAEAEAEVAVEAAKVAGEKAKVVVSNPELLSALLVTPSQLPGEAGELELIEPPY